MSKNLATVPRKNSFLRGRNLEQNLGGSGSKHKIAQYKYHIKMYNNNYTNNDTIIIVMIIGLVIIRIRLCKKERIIIIRIGAVGVEWDHGGSGGLQF